MPANNPSGTNGYEEFGVESPYGAIKRLEESTRAAPLPPMPGGNTPRKAQRRATGTQPAQQQQAQSPPPTGPDQVDPRQVVASVFMEMSRLPDASPLWAEYAQG